MQTVILELEVIEKTFSEIWKLQEKLFGDFKNGATAINKERCANVGLK